MKAIEIKAFEALKKTMGAEAATQVIDYIDSKTHEQAAELATKADLKNEINGLRTELKGDISSLRTELKGDINQVRLEIADVEVRLTRSIYIAGITQLLAVIAAVAGILKIMLG
jgi:hypothetical protein